MNLGELLTVTRTYLNEDAATVDKFWTDAELTTAIMTGVRYAHNKIKNLSRWHFTTRATFSTTSGTEYYGLPANLKDLKMLSYTTADGEEKFVHRHPGPNPFEWVDNGLAQVGNNVNSYDGIDGYWVVGSQLRILPVPSSTITVRLYYEARITSLVNSADVPSFDEDYHDLAAKWAAIEARTKNQDDPSDLYAMLEKREADMVQDLFHRLPHQYTATTAYLQGFE